MGHFNGMGLWTLYRKEVMRFMNVFTQTIMAPVVTTLLFLAVFTLALGRSGMAEGVSYAQFLAPGLVVMAMVQNAFANTSSSIMVSKIQGNIVDVLMPPLSSLELVIAYAGGGLTRGILVGFAVAAAMSLFVALPIVDFWAILFFVAMGSLMMSLLGVIGGIWADKFDHLAAVTNFVITPLSFLSGTFYSLERLPESWQGVALFNPFFYMIDGVRYGFIGWSDTALPLGAAILIGVNMLLIGLCYYLFQIGWRLKA